MQKIVRQLSDRRTRPPDKHPKNDTSEKKNSKHETSEKKNSKSSNEKKQSKNSDPLAKQNSLDRRSKHHSLDRHSKRESSEDSGPHLRSKFMRSWSLRRRSKTRSQLLESNFIDPVTPSEINCKSELSDISTEIDSNKPEIIISKPEVNNKSSEGSSNAESNNKVDTNCQTPEPIIINGEDREMAINDLNGCKDDLENSSLSARFSDNRLSADQELHDTVEQGFENNFLCLKSEEAESTVLGCNHHPQPLVGFISSMYLKAFCRDCSKYLYCFHGSLMFNIL